MRRRVLKSPLLEMQPRSGLGTRLRYPVMAFIQAGFLLSFSGLTIGLPQQVDPFNFSSLFGTLFPFEPNPSMYIPDLPPESDFRTSNSHSERPVTTHASSSSSGPLHRETAAMATSRPSLTTRTRTSTVPFLAPTTTSSPFLVPTTTSSPFLLPTTISSPSLVPTTTSSPSLVSTSALDPISTAIAAPQKKNHLGGILGGTFGALGLLCFLVLAVVVYRRRQRSSQATLIPLVHAPDYAQPLEKGERLARGLRSQDTEAQSQRDRLQMDLEVSPRPGSSTLPSSQGVWGERLQEQMEWMSQRIMVLEAHQMELESIQSQRLRDDLRQPPPDYSVTTTSGRNEALKCSSMLK
ncbi:hypothetical protein D9615_001994 [Tricholomella constricta]|uniref:Transmembrane protein n=1 Tax=Tricholomella constricta TaxID=117010 RepID=A0A8H5HPJ9_9AGAR|nr:hypothetical protein D9615_001994 [Tricholomella constricta]